MRSKPDLILIDIDHPDTNWGKTVKMLKTHFPNVRILAQTSFEGDRCEIDDLTAAITILCTGGPPLSLKASDPDQYQLTQREKEVLSCLVKGLSYKQIQFELYIAYETVRSHVKHIYEKLHVDSLTKLVAKAIREQLI